MKLFLSFLIKFLSFFTTFFLKFCISFIELALTKNIRIRNKKNDKNLATMKKSFVIFYTSKLIFSSFIKSLVEAYSMAFFI